MATMAATLRKQRSMARVVPDQGDSRQKAHLNKERILVCLTRLNEKSTQRAAAEDLAVIVSALDAEGAVILINNICTSTGAWEPKPFARKECIRTLGQMVGPECPVRDLILQQYLGKLVAYLKRHMQEADSAVRDACAEALTSLSLSLAEDQGELRTLPGNGSNPVLRIICECLAEQKKEGQLAASQALLQVADTLDPLDREYVKLLLRLLKSSTFQATAQLLAAIASTDPDSHQPVGLLREGSAAFLPYLGHLVGQPPAGSSAGSGVLGCLGSKDWAIRKAAADTLRATVALLGPQLEPEGACWEDGARESLTARCLTALEGAKFDKVKEARDVAREAAHALQELQLFMAQGGCQASWEARWQEEQLASPAVPHAFGATSGTARISPGALRVSSARPASPTGRGSLGGGVSEVFKRSAAQHGDVVVLDATSRPKSALGAAGSASRGSGLLIPARRCSAGSTEVGAGADGQQQAAPKKLPQAPHAPFPARESDVSQGGSDGDAALAAEGDAAQQLAASGAVQQPSEQAAPGPSNAGEEAALPSTAAESSARLDFMQQPPAQVRALPRSLSKSTSRRSEGPAGVASPGEVTSGHTAAARRASASRRSAGMEADAAGMVSLPRREWEATCEQLRLLQEQQASMSMLVAQLQDRSAAEISALQERVAALELQQRQYSSPARQRLASVPSSPEGRMSQMRRSTEARPLASPWLGLGLDGYGSSATRSADWATPGARPLGRPPSATPGSVGSMLAIRSCDGPADLEAAFTEALQRGDMHLLRVIQKTGPVWGQLSQRTAADLLSAFINSVKDGVMLHRILPWLWRLADEDYQVLQVPKRMKQALLEALASCPAAEDVQVHEKIGLLYTTLCTVWGEQAGGAQAGDE